MLVKGENQFKLLPLLGLFNSSAPIYQIFIDFIFFKSHEFWIIEMKSMSSMYKSTFIEV